MSCTASVKNLSLRLLLIVVTATDNVSQNVILEYLMMNSVFEAVMTLLSGPLSREAHGYDATVVLTLLLNYRKYEVSVSECVCVCVDRPLTGSQPLCHQTVCTG